MVMNLIDIDGLSKFVVNISFAYSLNNFYGQPLAMKKIKHKSTIYYFSEQQNHSGLSITNTYKD